MPAQLRKVLCIYQKSPLPDVSGNRRRLLRLVEAMDLRFDVVLLVAATEISDEDLAALSSAPFPTEFVQLPTVPASTRRLARWLVGAAAPFTWRRVDERRARDRVGEAVERHRADAVFSSSAAFVGWIGERITVPIAIDVSHIELVTTTSQIAGALGRPASLRRSWRRLLVHTLDLPARHRAERAGMRLASLAVPVSEVEHRATQRRTSTQSVVVKNGVDVPPVPGRSPEGRRIIFVANFGYPPNLEAAEILVADVLPRVLLVVPDARVDLVGSGIPFDHAMRDDPHVVVHGFVEDLDEMYRSSSVMVAPLRAGSGTKLKVLESFAQGVPVVTTPKGAEGLDVIDGVHLAVATSSGDLAARTAELIGDADRADALASAARTWVEHGYSWDTLGVELCDLLEGLMS